MSNSRKSSKTALMAAIHRFLAFKDNDFEGPDNMAKIFLPGKVKFLLSFNFIRESVKKKMRKLVPGTYEYVTARTNFFDEQFTHAVEERWPQIVLLGAGYDSRAVRLAKSQHNTRVFELDEPTIQREKIKFLNRAKIELPDQLTFVPIDFNHEDLANALISAGFDKDKKTLFLWEGVSMYLEEKAVTDMLKFISESSGPGSTIAFDYFDQNILDGKSESYGAKEITAEVKKSGEPFRFGIDPLYVGEFLKDHGFELIIHLTPEKLEQEYLAYEKNELLGKVYGFGYQVVATLPG